MNIYAEKIASLAFLDEFEKIALERPWHLEFPETLRTGVPAEMKPFLTLEDAIAKLKNPTPALMKPLAVKSVAGAPNLFQRFMSAFKFIPK